MFPGMADFQVPQITFEEIKMFYKMDRVLYSFLTNDLCRNPFASMRVMALWLWLEMSGFKNVVKILLTLSHFLINEIADEATMCLNYLMNPNPLSPLPEQIELPLTQNLLAHELNLNFFLENRSNAVFGIEKAMNDVCLRALSDLMQQAVERENARALAESQMALSSLFSRLNINNNFEMVGPRINNVPEVPVPADERTMFVTFSKGYPVPERDIREFFSTIYGDCIESLYMQDVKYGEQSLYARIVFYRPEVIGVVLNGVEKAKYTIKGRHMWMRKYVSKRKRSLSPPNLNLLGLGGSDAGSSSRIQ